MMAKFKFPKAGGAGRGRQNPVLVLFMSRAKSTSPGRSPAGGSPATPLQDYFTCGILVVDERGRIVACTGEAAKLLRRKPADLRNASVDSLPAPLPKFVRTAAKSGKTASNKEILSGEMTLRVNLLPVKAEVVVVLKHFSSVPFFAENETNMRRLDRLASLGMLSASMAHEIKNGLVAIKTFVELLAQKGEDAELTAVAGRELQRINALATQMLQFATPKHTTFMTVRVHELLDHALRLLQHQISGKMILLKRRFQAGPDTVRGDDAQLQQVFMNLLLNALEAMGTNSVLTVATDIVAGKGGARQLRIQIQDSGSGIAPENIGRLFEPFFTTKKNGTGLGLAISQRIAQEHKGRIEVNSDAGQGSTFSVWLPVSTEEVAN
jgi:signal transduction histidine kinase